MALLHKNAVANPEKVLLELVEGQITLLAQIAKE